MKKKSTLKCGNKKNLDKMTDNTFEKKCKKIAYFTDFHTLINQISLKKERKLDLFEFFEVLDKVFKF